MTDRELLEFAAKAAGIAYIKPAEGYDGRLGLAAGDNPMRTYTWNPLADDGDALRLAVKLRIGIGDRETAITAFRRQSMSIGSVYVEEFGDPIAATRLAITRAAAEIGRTMR
jgi:hypothetical protein